MMVTTPYNRVELTPGRRRGRVLRGAMETMRDKKVLSRDKSSFTSGSTLRYAKPSIASVKEDWSVPSTTTLFSNFENSPSFTRSFEVGLGSSDPRLLDSLTRATVAAACNGKSFVCRDLTCSQCNDWVEITALQDLSVPA